MKLLNYLIPGSVRVWFTQLLLGQQRQEQQVEEIKNQLGHLQMEVSEMRKTIESLINKSTLALMILGLAVGVGLAATPAAIDYFQTLDPNDTITISGDGCKPQVAPSLSPNQVKVKCFPPSE